jgi:predicted transcriptional regulator
VGDPLPVHAVKLDERGLARLFGGLEAEIMEAVWLLDEATVHDLCHQFGGDCNYKTIMTVANRLVSKGALDRRRCGRAYVYTPAVPRDEFLTDVSRETVAGLLKDFGAPAIRGFLDALTELTPEQAETLRRRIDLSTECRKESSLRVSS